MNTKHEIIDQTVEIMKQTQKPHKFYKLCNMCINHGEVTIKS